MACEEWLRTTCPRDLPGACVGKCILDKQDTPLLNSVWNTSDISVLINPINLAWLSTVLLMGIFDQMVLLFKKCGFWDRVVFEAIQMNPFMLIET